MISPGVPVPLLADSGPAPLLVAKANPGGETSMRQVREVLRLKLLGGIATRAIARRIGVAPSTVRASSSGSGFWFEPAIAGRDDRCRTRRIVPPARSFLGLIFDDCFSARDTQWQREDPRAYYAKTQSPSASPRTHNDRCLEARPHTGRTCTSARRGELWVVDAVRQ